jgi:hypothetical protein
MSASRTLTRLDAKYLRIRKEYATSRGSLTPFSSPELNGFSDLAEMKRKAKEQPFAEALPSVAWTTYTYDSLVALSRVIFPQVAQ